MTTAGWLVMIVSVGSVLGLTGYCFYKVLTATRLPENRRDFPDDA